MVPVIAVDGPSGSGKGTLAQRLAVHLQWHLLDSGALYRIVAARAEDAGVDPEDAPVVAALARNLDLRFDGDAVWLDGVDLGPRIRTEEMGAKASVVAALPPVRAAIVDLQHSFRRAPGLVADGRDMGTVIFPDAKLKLFLDASAEVRAERRYNQLKNKGLGVSLRGLLETIQQRDERDRTRAVSPLKPADDAVVIDSSTLSINEVVQLALREVEARGLG